MENKPSDFPRAASAGFMENILQWIQGRTPYSRGPRSLISQSWKFEKVLSS